VSCVVLAFAVAPFVVTPVTSSAASAKSATSCPFASLSVSVTNGDGLHHGVEFIRFANLSDHACTLRGYPTIYAELLSGPAPKNLVGMYHSSRSGSQMLAADVQMAWAGGVDTPNGLYPTKAAQRRFKPPLISLRARTGVATATLNWVDGPNTGTCPAFDEIRIGLNGTFVTRPLGLGFADPLCYEFDVTPIVRGTTGAMTEKTGDN
jgi:hypothetical protein